MLLETDDAETIALVRRYAARLAVPTDRLRVTTDKKTFETWLGRRVGSGIGGAYAFLPRIDAHAVLINLRRIDRAQPRAVEIVVAEELLHMRDHLDGDRRRHAKHGYDRIARRVAALVGTTLDEVRTCLKPTQRRPTRYLYACPGCGLRVPRRVRGRWSCGRCSPRFNARFLLRLVGEIGPET